MKTKAAFLCEQNAPLRVGVVEVPDLVFGQVLVRLRASGVCGKQLDEQIGTRGHDPYLPHLLGHEGGGVVEAIGPGVTKVSAGDHVIAGWMKGSGINAPTPEYRTEEGDRINAGNITTFQELSIISENRLTPIPKDVPFDVAAVLGCAIPTGFGIVLNQAQVKPGSTVAIYGGGGIGLSAVMAAGLVSPSRVIVIDGHEAKLQLAKKTRRNACAEFPLGWRSRCSRQRAHSRTRRRLFDRGSWERYGDGTGVSECQKRYRPCRSRRCSAREDQHRCLSDELGM